MKDERVGWLPFTLTIGFAVGLLGALIGSAWFDLPDKGVVWGFFGFGIPMLIAGSATKHMWHDNTKLLNVYGWTSSLLGTVFGISLFVFVAYRVINKASISTGELGLFFGFVLPMIILGYSGLRLLSSKSAK